MYNSTEAQLKQCSKDHSSLNQYEMHYALVAPILLAATALAVPVPNQNDVIGDASVAVNVGGDTAAGVVKRGDGGCY